MLRAIFNRKSLALIFLAMLVALSVLSCGSIPTAAASGAQAMCVMEKTSERVLNGYNMHARLPMASTTKVVTAITVIENTDDLNRLVTIPDCAVGVEGSSIYLVKGEQLKIIDLLHGLMLQSGNDAATALAVITGGTVESFAKMMNDTAKRVGAENSSFTNPHGLHDDNHYTTAYDLAKISCYAMRNEVFKKIVGTKIYHTPWKDREYGRTITNKNKILTQYEGGSGVKTGFTKKAGRCLVASSERDGMEVVAVVLNCGNMFGECKSLMTAAHNSYSMQLVSGRGIEMGRVPCENARAATVRVGSNQPHYYPLRAGESVEYRLDTVESLSAPQKAGAEIGSAQIYLGKQLLFDVKAFNIDDVRASDDAQHLKDIAFSGYKNP